MQASGRGGHDQDHGRGSWNFRRVSTFANYRNVGNVSELTVAEIVAATADDRTLVYTDAERGAIGFIDISDPAKRLAGGTLALDPDQTDAVSYRPTSVGVLRNQYALVAVDTSPSKAQPSGLLLVIDLDSRLTVATLDLGGQPEGGLAGHRRHDARPSACPPGGRGARGRSTAGSGSSLGPGGVYGPPAPRP